MKSLNWRKAKLRELYVILIDDSHATQADKREVEDEILRRNTRKHGRLQYKERRVYPK